MGFPMEMKVKQTPTNIEGFVPGCHGDEDIRSRRSHLMKIHETVYARKRKIQLTDPLHSPVFKQSHSHLWRQRPCVQSIHCERDTWTYRLPLLLLPHELQLFICCTKSVGQTNVSPQVLLLSYIHFTSTRRS